jgi:molybdate transport system substrate-binding protein
MLCLLLFLAPLCTGGCERPDAPHPLRIAAASSLEQPLSSIFGNQPPDKPVELIFASSGRISQQLDAGAPFDVVVLASAERIDELSRKGRLYPATAARIAANSVVLVTPANSTVQSLEDLLDPSKATRIGIGQPDTVPVGNAAQSALDSLSLRDELQPRFVYALSATQLRSYVDQGAVDAAVVYRTDARLLGDRVRVLVDFDDAESTVQYVAAVSRSTQSRERAFAAVARIGSPEAREAFDAAGFVTLNLERSTP